MTVTVSMSAVWVNLVTILCLSCTVVSDPESSEVLWRDCGEAITIQCRFSNPRQEYLEVKKGLSEDVSVLQKIGNSGQLKIGSEFTGRLQENGAFPNIDILIKNLTSEDTGPYWCLYKMSNESVRRKGKGSVLVVVKGEGLAPGLCNTSNEDLVLISVVISTAVLLSIIMAVLMWLIKTKTSYTAVKPRHDPINYVYEDMSGTLRG